MKIQHNFIPVLLFYLQNNCKNYQHKMNKLKIIWKKNEEWGLFVKENLDSLNEEE